MINRRKLAAAVCLAAALLVLLLPGRTPRQNGLTVVSLDVGQGDSLLVCADGYNVLIDAGGTAANATGMAEYVVIPYLKSQGIGRLDMVFNTHPDTDHIGGIFAVLDEIAVDRLAVFAGYPGNAAQEKLRLLAAEKQVPVLNVAAGQEFAFSGDFSIKVLAPQEGAVFDADMVNNGSLVLQISYQDFDLLVTGDLQGEQMWTAVADLDCLDIEVLQLPHHGSPNSYDEDWYDNFAPQAVFISVGRNNRYGHPGGQVVEYWQERGVPVWRTDLFGACRITYLNGQAEYGVALAPEPPAELSEKG